MRVAPADDPRFDAAAALQLGEQTLGRFGLLAPSLLDTFGLQGEVVAGEFDLPPLLAFHPPRHDLRELARFPAIERDLSILVDEAVPWANVDAAIRKADPALLESVGFLGTYRGKPIPPGRKSVSLRMQFRDPARTLRHDEVDPQVRAVVEALGDAVGAELRT